MKIKSFARHDGLEMIRFWCPGCGEFHDVRRELWNGETDNPTLNQATLVQHPEIGVQCVSTIKDGIITWADDSNHRLAGKSIPIQHEEAWRDGMPWTEPQNKKEQS